MVDRGVGVAVLRCGTDTAPGAKNQWGRASPPSSCLGGRRARTEDLRIKRAISVCGLVRILLISCVIASQLFARRGGGSRTRADSLRTPEVRGSNTVSMRCLLQVAPNARRAAHAQNPDGGPYGRCRPPRRARKLVNESGRTREAEARNNLSQDGEAVYTHVQDAGERAPQVLASRQECQEGR